MLDVTELFCRRVNALVVTNAVVVIDPPVPPWKLLEGKGYPERLGAADWAPHGLVRAASILDLATWLANHDAAHLEQLKALREGRWGPDSTTPLPPGSTSPSPARERDRGR
jgi:hypothetical protein